jgi:anti-sigma factor RsiW
MNITRDIIFDLLPLYLAGEASEDTRAAIESSLKEDPELAREVAAMKTPGMQEVPRAMSEEVEMEAYKKANLVLTIRTLGLAIIIAGTFLALVLIVPAIYIAIR